MPRSRSRNKQPNPLQSAARPVTPQPMPHQTQAIFAQKFHQGPLPPQEEFAGYERTLTGAADRILTMAERQSEHRQQIELETLHADNAARDRQITVEDSRIRGTLLNERIGQILGFAIAAGCLGGAVWGMIHGSSPVVIGLFLGLPIAGVIKAFLPKSWNGVAPKK